MNLKSSHYFETRTFINHIKKSKFNILFDLLYKIEGHRDVKIWAGFLNTFGSFELIHQ